MYEKQRETQQDSQQGPTEKQGQIKLSAFQGETGEHSVLIKGKMKWLLAKDCYEKEGRSQCGRSIFSVELNFFLI